MRWIDIYAIVASLITIGVTVFFSPILWKQGPQRGFGAGQALIMVVGAVGAAVLHGAVACLIAVLMKGPTPVTWICAGLHALIILAAVALAVFK